MGEPQATNIDLNVIITFYYYYLLLFIIRQRNELILMAWEMMAVHDLAKVKLRIKEKPFNKFDEPLPLLVNLF